MNQTRPSRQSKMYGAPTEMPFIETEILKLLRAIRVFSARQALHMWSVTKRLPSAMRLIMFQVLLGCAQRDADRSRSRRSSKKQEDWEEDPEAVESYLATVDSDWNDLTARTFTTILSESESRSKILGQTESTSQPPSIGMSEYDIVKGDESHVDKSAVELLEPPTVSPGDDKEYRVIQLPNGVKATVIYEPQKTQQGVIKIGSSTNLTASLERDFMAVPVEEQLAACSVTVRAGSFQDPDDIPGLSHLLEHVVSMGSKKYPGENAFNDFLENSGGSYNAETDCDHTTFYFECHKKFFQQGLDMFSQFFKSPPITEKSVSSEIKAIDEEFKSVRRNDNARRMQIISNCATKDNPAKKFTWGNSQTLTSVSKGRLMEALLDYQNTHFTADNMSVAIQASIFPDELINLIEKHFGDMRKSQVIKQPPVCGYPFNRTKFRRFYKVKSIKDRCELNLNWAFWPMSTKYRTKPLEYLSYWIAAESEGSLICHLRRKGWALFSSAEVEEGSLVSNSVYTIFTVCFSLTKEGRANIEQVLKSFFEYLKMLEEVGPSKQLFEELRKVAELNFRDIRDIRAIDNAKMVSRHMTIYPSQDYLTGWILFMEYCPTDIADCLQVMTADNVNILLHTREHDASLPRTEPWFQTPYRDEEIPNKWIQECINVQHTGFFREPNKNPYIATDFSLVEKETNDCFPIIIKKTEVLELWFKGDDTFNTPHIAINILISTAESVTLENTVCRMLFAKMLRYQLISQLYYAHIALIKQKINAVEQGLEISIIGLSHKLPLVLKVVAQGILDFQTKLKDQRKILDHLKKMMKSGFIKTLTHGPSLLEDIRKSALMNVTFRCGDKYRCVNDITNTQLEQHCKSLLREAHVVALVQGNILSADASKLMEDFVGLLGMQKGDKSRRVRIKPLKIPKGKTILCVEAFHPREQNCYSQFYYQYGPGSEKESAALQVFIAVIEKYFIAEIHHMDFQVSSCVSEIQGVLGILVTVRSKMNKFSLEYVRRKVDYLMSGVLWYMGSISAGDFAYVTRTVKSTKAHKLKCLKDESLQNWWEIKTGQYIFDRNTKEVSELTKISKAFVTQVVEKMLCPNHSPSTARKFVIQIKGFDIEKRAHLRLKPHSMKSFVEADDVVYGFLSTAEGETATIVKDMSAWKESLLTYPK